MERCGKDEKINLKRDQIKKRTWSTESAFLQYKERMHIKIIFYKSVLYMSISPSLNWVQVHQNISRILSSKPCSNTSPLLPCPTVTCHKLHFKKGCRAHRGQHRSKWFYLTFHDINSVGTTCRGCFYSRGSSPDTNSGILSSWVTEEMGQVWRADPWPLTWMWE